MPQKVLVIDDSRSVRVMVRSCLVDEPIDLVFAGSAAEGLKAAQSCAPDLILLDVEMPDVSGFEVCRLLKANLRTAGIPVVFLTAHSSTAEKVRGLDLGAIDYVTKPFDPAELCARVRASLRNKFMFDLLAQKAMIDGLTGLGNRAYLDRRLAEEIAVSTRHRLALSVIMADVDRFKSVNDSHGHPFGDEVLRRVARVLCKCARKEDVICRYGGEEFALLLPGVPLEGGKVLAERIRQVFYGQVIQHRDVKLQVSCSFGVAQFAGGGPEDLMAAADGALYQAKRDGRNRVVGAPFPSTAPVAA